MEGPTGPIKLVVSATNPGAVLEPSTPANGFSEFEQVCEAAEEFEEAIEEAAEQSSSDSSGL